MKAIILSVNPPHAGKLVDGIKTNEWRTKTLPIGKTYIYETKKNGGCGLVIGEVDVIASAPIPIKTLNNAKLIPLVQDGCVGVNFLQEYAAAHNTDKLYANIVEKAVRYDKPKELSEFKHVQECPYSKKRCIGMPCDNKKDCIIHTKVRVPQSWCYVEEL